MYRVCITSVLLLTSIVSMHMYAEEPFHPFFAYKNSMENKVPAMEEQAAILADIGFDGYDHRELEGLEEALLALDAKGLKLYTIYFSVDIDASGQPYNCGWTRHRCC